MQRVSFSTQRTVTRDTLTPECVHCGLCLQACPTYIEQGHEADSPRGRLYLMRAQQRGIMGVSEGFVKHISACLDCRACESACPSGVAYGEMVEEARELIEKTSRRALPTTVLRWIFFNIILPSRLWLRMNFMALRYYQLLGLQKAVRAMGILELLPGHLSRLDEFLPDLRPRTHHVRLGTVYPANGTARHRVGLLTGCVMNEIFGDVNQATIRVLQRYGCEVVVPGGQTCCGALHSHAGLKDTARALALRNMNAFETAAVDVIISNASGCGAKLIEYPALFSDNPSQKELAENFARKVKDVSAFLDGLPEPMKPRKIGARVAYDDPCHLLHVMKVNRPPRNLLRLIPDLELVELRTPELCCGSAGIYNITHFDLSMKILARKIADIEQAKVDMVATGNPGCILQITCGLRQAGLKDVKVVHPIELLDRAYSGQD